jgi:hypothetical protein
MKKAGSMKFLAAVAIVSSATVMQIRAHVAAPETAPARASGAMPACGSGHEGVMPASCAPMRDERQLKRQQPPHDAPRLWV